MNLNERIEEISTLGRTHTIVEVNALVSDIVNAVSSFSGIPADEVMKWVEDGVRNG